MWIDTTIEDENVEQYLSSVGRAMYLCRNFETNFKTALVWLDLATAHKAGKLPLSKEALMKSYADKFLSQMLGHSVRRLKEEFHPSEYTLETLNTAKDSRNVIVHDATSAIMNAKVDAIKNAAIMLHKHVVNVAEGDNIVSAWHYEIQNKKQPTNKMTTSYIDDVVEWVFKPLGSDLHPLKS